jgi:hypothetical protein
MDMDKVKTITLAVIAVALLFIGYSLYQISQNGRYTQSFGPGYILDSQTGISYNVDIIEEDGRSSIHPLLPPK